MFEITQVRLTLANRRSDRDRCLGYASVNLDNALTIHDLRLIEGNDFLMVAMPSRPMTDRCPDCNSKNAASARYCDQCGKLREPFDYPRPRRHWDICHPLTLGCRKLIEYAVIDEYERMTGRTVGEVSPDTTKDDACRR